MATRRAVFGRGVGGNRGNASNRGGRGGQSTQNFGIGRCVHCGRSERCERYGFIRNAQAGRGIVAEHAIGYRLAPRDVEGPIDQNEYVLKNVISRKSENGALLYLIEEDYPHSADYTWESIENLIDNIAFVVAYEIGLTRSVTITIDQLRRAVISAHNALRTVAQPTTSRAAAVEVAAEALARLVNLNPLLLGERRMSDLGLLNVGVTLENTRDVSIQTELPPSEAIAIQTETIVTRSISTQTDLVSSFIDQCNITDSSMIEQVTSDETLGQQAETPIQPQLIASTQMESTVEPELIRNRAAAAAIARALKKLPTSSNVDVNVSADVLNEQPEASTLTQPTTSTEIENATEPELTTDRDDSTVMIRAIGNVTTVSSANADTPSTSGAQSTNFLTNTAASTDRPYACCNHLCKYKATNASNLKRHKKIATNAKPPIMISFVQHVERLSKRKKVI